MGKIYTLSPMQQGIFFHDMLSKDNIYYNQARFDVKGTLSEQEFRESVQILVDHHEALRARYYLSGEEKPKQEILEHRKQETQYIDLSGRSLEEGKREIDRIALENRNKQHDLGTGDIMDVFLFKVAEDRYTVLWGCHHIAIDGWCMSILIKELFEIYHKRSQGDTFTVEEVPYSNYLDWMEGSDPAKVKAYWENYLEDVPAPFMFPTQKKGKSQCSDRIAYRLEIDAEKMGRIKELASTNHVTVGTIIQGIWGLLLCKYSNQNEAIWGCVTSGRSVPVKDVGQIIGLFINTLPLIFRLDRDQALLGQLKKLTMDLFQTEFNSHVSLSDINSGQEALFNHIFAFENLEFADMIDGVDLFGKTLENPEFYDRTNYDLAVKAQPGRVLTMDFEYNPDVYREEAIAEVAGAYAHLIDQLLEDPERKVSDYKLLTETQEQALIAQINKRSREVPQASVQEKFLELAEQNPDRVAMVSGSRSMTYQKLRTAAERVAAAVQAAGVQPGDIVGVDVDDDNMDTIVCIWGVLLAGCAYLPFDKNLPRKRREYFMDLVQTPLVFTEHPEKFISEVKLLPKKDTVSGTGSAVFHPIAYDPKALAYVLFTSGSTGEPKGVCVSCGALCAFGSSPDMAFAGTSEDITAQISVLSFDASIAEIFVSHLTGGTLCLASEQDKETASGLIQFFRNNHVTRTFITTQLFNLIVDEDPTCFHEMRLVTTGGERASARHLKAAAEANPDTKIVNVYGPTEIVSMCSGYQLKPGSEDQEEIPIGLPDPYHTYYILDDDRHICPEGTDGELYVGGILADGYYKRDDITAEHFVDNPYAPGHRVYKTGDIVNYSRDHEVVFVKRRDEQVKIRGFRIEANEIESALCACDGVKSGYIKIVKNEDNEWRIWAYYIADEILSKDALASEMKQVLPSYMIPNGFLQLSSVPINKNGKLDRKLLPDIQVELKTEFVLPETELQQKLLNIWQEVLGDKDLGIRHNFFEAGGDSIKAMQIIGLMKKQGMNAEIRRLFDNPTVESFAPFVYMGELEDQGSVTGPVPLMPIQKYFFGGKEEGQNQFNQSVLLRCKAPLSVNALQTIAKKLTDHHDALRMIYTFAEGQWVQEDRDTNAVSYRITEASYDGSGTQREWLDAQIEMLQKGMDMEQGILMNLGLLHMGEETLLFIAVHHLVMDGVSFRILLRDFGELYTGYLEDQSVDLIPKTVSYKRYSEAVSSVRQVSNENLAIWENIDVAGLDRLAEGGHTCKLKDCRNKTFVLEKSLKQGLDSYVNAQRGVYFSDLMLTVTASAIQKVTGMKRFPITVEHNGRSFNHNQYDVSNTIGWFTCIYPLIFKGSENREEAVRQVVQDQVEYRKYSSEFMIRKTFGKSTLPIYQLEPEICFNYLGDFDSVDAIDGPFEIVVESMKQNRSGELPTSYVVEINALSLRDQLYFMIDYDPALLTEEQIDAICGAIEEHAAAYGALAQEKLYEPFGLSSLQMAYFIGKQDFYELGGFTTHNYIEFVTKVDIPRLNRVLQKIIDCQDMLRTVMLPDGTQHVLRNKPQYTIEIEDLRSLTAEQQEAKIQERRSELSHSVFDVYHFPLFEINGFQLSDEEKYLFISYDMIMMDSASINLMVRDLAYGYFHPDYTPEPLKYHYRDYIHDLEEMRTQPIYDKARDYWRSKLDDFPEAPQLPMIADPESIEKGHFVRRNRIYSKHQREIMKKQATQHGMTLSALLMSAYGHMLNFYSGMDQFTVNLTLFNRPSFNPEIERMYGDFTSTILLDFDLSKHQDFWKESEAVQLTLSKALEYRIYDGIHFSKDVMKKFRYPTKKAMMPIVFTSLLFETDVMEDVAKLGEVKWSIGQTPQVYVDFQVLSEGGNLVIQMDCVSELFDPDMMDDLFHCFCSILDEVVLEQEDIHPLELTDRERRQREAYNNTNDENPPETTLIDLFAKTAARVPDKEALVSGDDVFTYRQLDEYSDRVAEYLEREGLAGTPIGLYAARKAGSIINILGILKAGSAYVPMLPDFPKERVDYICKSSQIQKILYEEDYLSMPEAKSKERPHWPVPDDTAYVLYTSGSTGTPKGVEILHRTVANTIIVANDAYGIHENDVFIGLSALSFDMSVYDVFGSFEIGGRLIMVPDVHAIEHIADLVEQHHVTVWQTVPALMQMYMGIRTPEQGSSLRHVLLGGDFIPKQLARDILSQLPDVNFMSVGGPTETSIFDIYYPVSEVRDEWRSIPYGFPIRNQQIYIMDSQGRECPNEVRGEICVGGLGLAKGYVNQPELNAEKFFMHPQYGRIFRTGDYGIFKNEGYVEITGRIDGQVKIQGFRIELGEIENVFLNHPKVSQAVALIFESKNGSKQIAVFVEADPNETTVQEFLDYGASYLTSYMRPSVLEILEKIPLTTNNKIDRRSLMDGISHLEEERAQSMVPPQNKIEEKLLQIWKDTLELEQAGVEDDFFESGGDSLKAMELLSAVKKGLNWKSLLLTDILRNVTIRSLADFYLSGGTGSILREMTEIRPDHPKVFFIHGGNGSADSYQKMIDSLDGKASCYGVDYLHEITLAPQVISLKGLAQEYAADIMKAADPSEEICLAGWCIGGTICFEIAYLLEQKGYEKIRMVFLDTQEPGTQEDYTYTVPNEITFMEEHHFGSLAGSLKTDGTVQELWESVVALMADHPDLEHTVREAFIRETSGVLMQADRLSVREQILLNNFFRSLVDAAEKVSVSGVLHHTTAVYVHAAQESAAEDPTKWQRYFDKPMTFTEMPGTHFDIMDGQAEACGKWIMQ